MNILVMVEKHWLNVCDSNHSRTSGEKDNEDGPKHFIKCTIPLVYQHIGEKWLWMGEGGRGGEHICIRYLTIPKWQQAKMIPVPYWLSNRQHSLVLFPFDSTHFSLSIQYSFSTDISHLYMYFDNVVLLLYCHSIG